MTALIEREGDILVINQRVINTGWDVKEHWRNVKKGHFTWTRPVNFREESLKATRERNLKRTWR